MTMLITEFIFETLAVIPTQLCIMLIFSFPSASRMITTVNACVVFEEVRPCCLGGLLLFPPVLAVQGHLVI